MNDTKKRGRSKQFDQEEALQAAVKVFWDKGYEGASMKDLTTAMGINGPSLYATFGDKQALYIKAIESYSSNHACEPIVAFESEPDIYLAIQAFLNAVIESATHNEDGVKGCFLSACVATSSGHVAGVQPLLAESIKGAEQRLAARFDLEKSKGNLAEHFPSLERAQLMFDLRQGYVFKARAGFKSEEMQADIATRAKMILA